MEMLSHASYVMLAALLLGAPAVARFLLGSTVIVLFPTGAVELDPALRAGMPIRMGERIGLSG